MGRIVVSLDFFELVTVGSHKNNLPMRLGDLFLLFRIGAADYKLGHGCDSRVFPPHAEEQSHKMR